MHLDQQHSYFTQTPSSWKLGRLGLLCVLGLIPLSGCGCEEDEFDAIAPKIEILDPFEETARLEVANQIRAVQVAARLADREKDFHW